MIGVNNSSRYSRVLNRQPIQFSDAKNKHECLGRDDNYSFDASIDQNGRAYNVYIPAEREAFYNLNATEGPIYVLANTKNTTGRWITPNEIEEARLGWEQIQDEYSKQYPLIGKYADKTLNPPDISLDTSYVITDEDEAKSRFNDGDQVDEVTTRWQDSMMKLPGPGPDEKPVFINNIFDGDSGEPSSVTVREPDGTITHFNHQVWMEHG